MRFIFLTAGLLASTTAFAQQCSSEQLADILAPATPSNDSVEVRCSTTLPANSRQQTLAVYRPSRQQSHI